MSLGTEISLLLKGAAPGHQEVLVFEEQRLCDNVFVALQPVQSALIDDVPHNHVCVLRREDKRLRKRKKKKKAYKHWDYCTQSKRTTTTTTTLSNWNQNVPLNR